MDIEGRVDKLEEDAYRGRGPANPPFTSRLAELETDMIDVKKGVSNFRKFQARGSTFFDKAEAIWVADKARRARNLAIAGILAIPLTAAAGYIGARVVGTIETIMSIEQEWKQAHPSEFVKPQSMQKIPDPQDAKKELAY